MITTYKGYQIDCGHDSAIISKDGKYIKGFTSDYLGLPIEVSALDKCKKFIDSQ